jgi:hypothetical protein
MADGRLSRDSTEAAIEGVADGRLSRESQETILEGIPAGRLSRESVEVAVDQTPPQGQLARESTEVLIQGTLVASEGRLSRESVEILIDAGFVAEIPGENEAVTAGVGEGFGLPAVRPTKASGAGRLGCGINEAFITWKCGSPRLCSLTGATEIQWGRILDDVSEAEVTISLAGSLDATCCDCLGDIEPWCHELHITRDGETVWLGPVVEVIYAFESVTIRAQDLLGWTKVRVAENDIDMTADITTIAQAVLAEAFNEDDPCTHISATPAGGDTTSYFSEAFSATAFEQLEQLSNIKLNYTAIGRTIILGPEDLPLVPIATLTDDMILSEVTLTKSGLLQGNRWWVRYEGDGGVPGVGQVDQQCYGLIERLRPNDDGIQDATTANEVAQAYANAAGTAPRLLELEAGARLSPETPWDIQDMVPGTKVNVSLARLCVDTAQRFRLTGMSVRQSEEGEEVSLSLSPVDLATESL